MRRLCSLGLILCLILASGCSTVTKTAISYQQKADSIPSPILQTLMYDTITAAVGNIKESGDASSIKGKKLSVEIHGIFPMDYMELPAYIEARVKAELARRGALIVEAGDGESAKNCDYNVIITLNKSGIDATYRSGTALSLGQLSLITLGSVMTVVGAMTEAPGTVYAISGSMIAGGIGWRLAVPPKKDCLLKASVDLDLCFLPQSPELKYFSYQGSAEKTITSTDTGEDQLRFLIRGYRF